MRMYDIIEKKKNGYSLSKAEIDHVIDGYTSGNIPDYQMSALLMAICFIGMSNEEIYNLTIAMRDSGEILDLSKVEGIKVDKHSTGGVGDKASLVLGPMVAACGVPVAKMSGRGLGHTGGTIDKLESFTGFDITPSGDDFIERVNKHKISWAGQTANLAPADKKIYALRDVTATVDSLPLIASSIMSKKLASGADAIVLDVTCGNGAFMKSEEDAVELANIMIDIGKRAGKKMSAVITNMDEPLGNTVGNSIEVIEAIQTLKGEGPKDVLDVSLALGSHMLVLGGKCRDLETARNMLLMTIKDKSALDKMAEWVKSQGGNDKMVYDTSLFELGKYEVDVIYNGEAGFYVNEINTTQIGLAAMVLGGGRLKKDDVIDLSVGVKIVSKIGKKLKNKEIISKIYANNEKTACEAKKIIKNAYSYSEKCPKIKGSVISEI